MKIRIIVTAVLAAALLVPAAPAVAAPSRTTLAKQVKKLKRERTKLRRTVRRERRSARTWKARAGDRLTRLNSAYGQIGALKGPLPGQVAAIAREDNIEQLFNLVIRPAFTNWPCGGDISYYESFYSLSFDRRFSDGTCF